MAAHSSKAVAYAALAGNALIALSKFAAAAYTGNSAMLSGAATRRRPRRRDGGRGRGYTGLRRARGGRDMADDRGLKRWRYRLGRHIEPGDVWTRQRAKAWWWVAGFIVVAVIILLWLSLAGGGPEPAAVQ